MLKETFLSVEHVAPLNDDCRAGLDQVSKHGFAAWSQYLALPPDVLSQTLSHVEFILRRWVLELLLVIRQGGEPHYGAISRALGGLPSGSLSPKLRDLEAAGLVQVRQDGERRRYSITAAAMDLTGAIYCLAISKSYHHAHVKAGNTLPDIGSFTRIGTVKTDPATEEDLQAAIDEYAKAAAAFYDLHADAQTPETADTNVDTARRFTEACGRKWHGVIMICLARGHATFSRLKEMAGIGDQALSNALKEMQVLETVRQTEDGYELAPFGVFDMGIGTSMVALYQRIAERSPSE